jgi:sirohydrochlorin ferrochelatase
LKTGIIIFAHGSTVESANAAVRAVAEDAARLGGFPLYEVAFLDCAHPTLEEAVAAIVERGAQRVLVVPYFLTLGTHLTRDLPGIVDRLERIHPGREFRVTPPLDGHPALQQIVAERAREALREWKFSIPQQD